MVAFRPVKGVLPRRRSKRGGKRKRPFRSGHERARGRDGGRHHRLMASRIFGETFQFIRGGIFDRTDPWRSHFVLCHPQELRGRFQRRQRPGPCERGESSGRRGAGHNLLMIGPPGSGKSMLSKTDRHHHATDVARGSDREHEDPQHLRMLSGEKAFVSTRPFRSPHHTLSDVGLLAAPPFPSPAK